jgi:hypothetical protein
MTLSVLPRHRPARRGDLVTILCAALLFQSHIVTAQAADIKIIASEEQTGGAAVLMISGDIQPGDEKRFEDASKNVTNAIVALQGSGIEAKAALDIAKLIRSKGFATAVPENSDCSAACAFAWLGGKTRTLTTSSKLSFRPKGDDAAHGRPSLTLNSAVIGATLNQLGLSENAIAFLTSDATEVLSHLSGDDLRKYGLDFALVDVSDSVRGVSIKGDKVNASESQKTSISKSPPTSPLRAAILIATPTKQDPKKVATYVGTVIWEMSEDASMIAKVQIPEAKFTSLLAIQNNNDKSLPASYIATVRFEYGPNSPIPEIVETDTLQMRDEKDPKTFPLPGARTKLAANAFIIAISNNPKTQAQSRRLLAEKDWFDLPVKTRDNRIAKITLEKGEIGREMSQFLFRK